jgi:hypothetical protein
MTTYNADNLIAELRAAGIISGANREKTSSQWWLGDGTQRFLVIRGDTVELWQDNRPFAINARLDSLPLEQATADTVACLCGAVNDR